MVGRSRTKRGRPTISWATRRKYRDTSQNTEWSAKAQTASVKYKGWGEDSALSTTWASLMWTAEASTSASKQGRHGRRATLSQMRHVDA